MSASEALSGQQFVHHTELAKMYSGDYDIPMSELGSDHDFRTQEHPAYADLGSGGPGQSRRHVARLARSISLRGMQEPITVRGGNVITDGHHRALAAMQLGMEKVPVRHIR